MRIIIYPLLLLLGCAAGVIFIGVDEEPRTIGATERVTEIHSGLPFMARIDTGAHSCSIHCENIEIEDAVEDPQKNVGKQIRFLVRNKRGQSKWVTAVIADYVNVRTSESLSGRYKVRLELSCLDVCKDVLVTLNNRQNMRYPMLIGRNFLRDDFLVAVD